MQAEADPPEPQGAAGPVAPGPGATEAAYALVSTTGDAIVVVDEVGVVHFANPAAATLFGRSIADLLEQPFGLPLPAVQPGDVEILRRDGRVLIAEMRVSAIIWRSAQAFLVHLRDITDRKQIEQLLLQSQQVLSAALDHLASGIVIVDAVGGVIATNQAWVELERRMHGAERRIAVGQNYLAALEAGSAQHPTCAALTAGVGAVLRGDLPAFDYECVIDTPEGRRWFAIYAVACGDGWARAVLTHTEITQQKRQAILEADKRQILELVARQQGLETVIGHMLAMAADRYPDLVYAALALQGSGHFSLCAGGVPEREQSGLDSWAADLVGEHEAAASHTQAIQVTPLAGAAPEDHPAAATLKTIAVCWQARFHTSDRGSLGPLILCRRVDARPAADDLAFIELIGQLLMIAFEQHERIRLLAHQAHHDALTGLPNRVLFEDRLRQDLETARRTRRMLAVLFIDLDRFKQINDTLGHAVGDALLVQLARRYEGCVRATDTLARRGGDEFMLVLPQITSAQQVTRVARRLHEMLRMPFLINGHEMVVGASIGASLYPNDGEDADTLQRNADAAMYRAKKALRNSFQFFDARVNKAAFERLQLENHLRGAIERGELALHYQPKIDRQGRLVGAEALLRWQHPELGLVAPGRFIPIAEELGLIVPIGEWCIGEICRQASQWQRRGLPPVRMAANVSASQFAQPGFIAAVTQSLADSELDPAWLELELTEGTLMGDAEAIARQLSELRSHRLTLAIDDFGTGFSSMAHLQRLPINVLKIDRLFVSRLGQPGDDGSRGIVSAIVTLGHHLQMELVAEGVETEAQHSFLQSIGCDMFQGYLFSQPLPAHLFERLLHDGGLPPPA